jgi:putative two-component system response regulator
MLVDDNMATLAMGRRILRDHYEVYPMPSVAKFFETLEHVVPDMILLDIEMPEMNGYQVIRRLKEDRRFIDIPVIFVTARTDEGSELEGLSLGAIDYIGKPFSAPLLLKRLENHLLSISQKKELARYNSNLQNMVQEQTWQIFDLQSAVLSVVADMVESRDDVTGNHITRTQKYLQLLIDALAKERLYQEESAAWDMRFLVPSAQLHDVGKIAISDAILNKPGKLTAEEFAVMRNHVALGVRIIEKIEISTPSHAFLRHAKTFAATHHEKWDGSGYPNRLVGLAIPLEGRLLAIADVYDALISIRPYKKPLAPEEAATVIARGGGAHFDPALVELFIDVADDFAHIAANPTA